MAHQAVAKALQPMEGIFMLDSFGDARRAAPWAGHPANGMCGNNE
ncbi:hypothetical protein [Gordoniibacillus kamchatkensis]|nr:hypothetical protein [Paenibacillus sp. VKM B-2647]